MLNHGYERRNKHRNHKLLEKPLPKPKKIKVNVEVVEPQAKHMKKETSDVKPLAESTYESYPKPYVSDMKEFDNTLDELLAERHTPSEGFKKDQQPMSRVKQNTKVVSLDEALEPTERINHNLAYFTLILLWVFAAILVVFLGVAALVPGGMIERISSAGLLAYAIFASAVMGFVLLTPTIWFVNVCYQVYISHQWHKTNDSIPYRNAKDYLYTTTLNFFIAAGVLVLAGLAIMILGQVNPSMMSLTANASEYVNVLTYLMYTSGFIFAWMGTVSYLTYHGVNE